MATKTNEAIQIPAIQIDTFSVKVVGDAPLIMHKWSEKAKKELLDNMMRVAKTRKKDPKNPLAEFIDSMHWLSKEPIEKTEEGFEKAIQEGATFGFPAVAFKAAAVSAGYRMGITKDKVSTNAAFHILGDMVQINGTPCMREDMVTIGMGKPDVRYRGEFRDWSAIITVRYNSGIFTKEQIVNLLNMGGFACGVGEWRIEKGGTYGAFHVE